MEIEVRLGRMHGAMLQGRTRRFIEENNLITARDAQDALKELFAETLQEMLEAEMDTRI